MKNLPYRLVLLFALIPAASFAQSTRLTEPQMLQLATERGTCGPDRAPVSARYHPEIPNQINVTCDEVEAVVPLIAAAGFGAGLATAGLAGLTFVALVSGSGGGDGDTGGGGGGGAPPSTF